MNEQVCMPNIEEVVNTGPEWLLHLLSNSDEHQHLPLLMTMWRIWHVRNEITHQKKPLLVHVLTHFLCSYIESLMCLQQHPHGDLERGKMVVTYDNTRRRKMEHKQRDDHISGRPPERWIKPPTGWNKLNVDGAYAMETSTGGAGMILRDEDGAIVFASSRHLRTCISPVEAELAACIEGISLAYEWSPKPFIADTDSQVSVNMIKQMESDRSPSAAIVGEIKSLLAQGREYSVVHVCRGCNNVAHRLAQIGHHHMHTSCLA